MLPYYQYRPFIYVTAFYVKLSPIFGKSRSAQIRNFITIYIVGNVLKIKPRIKNCTSGLCKTLKVRQFMCGFYFINFMAELLIRYRGKQKLLVRI